MKSRKPAWWKLYALVPIMFLLVAAEHWLPLPGASPELVDAGIVVFTFGAMLTWVHLNGGLLEWYEVDKDGASYDLGITVDEPRSEAGGNGDGPDDSTTLSMPRPFAHVADQQGLRLKEGQKWFLN